jgi:hypothetical protein
MSGKARNPGNSTTIKLAELKTGFPHVPKHEGAAHANAVVIALDQAAHVSGVAMQVEGEFAGSYDIKWSFKITQAMRSYWNDLDVVAEQGAVGVALLLMRAKTGLTVVERARKKTGFDWWLGPESSLLFQKKQVRLEVSGILRGDTSRVNARLKKRSEQTKQSDDTNLKAYVIVVEFSSPRAKVETR